MNSHTLRFVTGALVLAGSVVAAQAANTNMNRFGISYRMGFNVSVDLKSMSTPFAGPIAADVNDTSYDDGFVGVDSTGNAGGLTTRWGYAGAGQVAPDNSAIVMHSGSSVFKGEDADPLHGFELTYNRELGRSERFAWGLEAAFNWANLDFSQDSVAPNMAAYALGYTPPLAPYEGPVISGPGLPLLGATPMSVGLNTTLDANIYGFRLGPYLDVPLSDRFTLTVGGGLAFACVEGDFSYRESFGHNASSSDSDFLVGGYISAQVSWALNDRWSIFTGLQYQPLQSYTQRAGDKEVELDFSGALFWTLGASFSF